MDFGTIIKSPMQDKDWLSKCAIIGLLCLIPIAGGLNLMGWMKAAYASAKAGDTTLPKAGLDYIGSGWAMFLALLPLYLVLFGLSIVVGIVAGVAKVAILTAVLNLVNSLVSLVASLVIMPTLAYRHVVHGKGFADGFDMAGIMKVISTNTGLFGTYALTFFVGNLIGGLGIIACCVGIIVTLPYAWAVQANAIKSFEQANGGL